MAAHQDEALAHGAGFKAHGVAALRGTGSALSHAKDALSEKMAAKRYEKYEQASPPRNALWDPPFAAGCVWQQSPPHCCVIEARVS